MRRLADVHRMVADALEVAERVQILCGALAVAAVQLRAGKLHQIRAELILVAVDQILRPLYLLRLLLVIAEEQRHRRAYIVPRRPRHGVYGQAALLYRKRRVRKEALVEPVKLGVDVSLRLALLYKARHYLFEHADKRQQHQRRRDPEQ